MLIYPSKTFMGEELDENGNTFIFFIILLKREETFQTFVCVSVRSDKERAQVEIMLSFSGARVHSLGKIDISLGISFYAQSTKVNLSFPSSPGNRRILIFNLCSCILSIYQLNVL